MKKIRILNFLCIILYLFSCGYQPILNETNKKFSITSFEISGDKSWAILINRFGKSRRF